MSASAAYVVTMHEISTMETIRMDTVTSVPNDVGDLAVEAAFPKSGIIRMGDPWLKENKSVRSDLHSGRLYHRGGISTILTSGSHIEGLAMETKWGHPDADWDIMYLNGGTLGVYVSGGQQPRGKSCLHFHPAECPAAYCKLEVTDLRGLKDTALFGGDDRWCDESCVDESDGLQWLNTYNVVQKMKDNVTLTCDGPAVTGPASHPGDNCDLVQTFVCSGPHLDLQEEFQNRPRGPWPLVSLIKYILQMPMLLVLVGHKGSPETEFQQQARMSWSHLELILIQELPLSVRQGYIASKYVMKRFLEAHKGHHEDVDGRSRVGSYHIKVVFLRFLEKRPPSQITSPFRLFLDLLCELDNYLMVGSLPHYFLAECNLLETVADDEQGIARQVIAEILSDPLNALLINPTDPHQIYGEVHPDDLVTAFRGVSSHPTLEQYQNLCELLARIDERRRQRFKEQQDRDETLFVSERTDLTELADMLKEIQVHDI